MPADLKSQAGIRELKSIIPIAFAASSNMGYFSRFNLGAILFNIFLCDMFFMIDTIDIASCADYNTPYSVGKYQCDIETKLQEVSVKPFK